MHPRVSGPTFVRTYDGGVALIGADTPPPPATTLSLSEILKAITPTLIVVGIVGGASFALGSGLVSRLIFNNRPKR